MSIMSKEETQAAHASGCPHSSVSKSFVRAIETVVRENYKGPKDGLPALLYAYVVLLSQHSEPGHFQAALENSVELLSSFTGVGDGADLPDDEPKAEASEVSTTGDAELDKLCELISAIALVQSGGDKDKALAAIDEILGKIHPEEHTN